MATHDLDRLSGYVKKHRLELFTSRKAAADAAGISKDTWLRVESGLQVRESTYPKIDRALGWAAGSCVAIAEGGEPALAAHSDDGSPAEAPAAAPLDAETLKRAAFEAARAKLPNAPIGDLDAFSDELVEILRRGGSVTEGP